MYIKSERFIITDLTMDMCNDYQKNSVDDDNRRFVPDEVNSGRRRENFKMANWVIFYFKRILRIPNYYKGKY